MEVLTVSGEVKKHVELPPEWFNRSGPKSLLWEAVRCYLANSRQGSVKTKTRGEVSGTNPGLKSIPGGRDMARGTPLFGGVGVSPGVRNRETTGMSYRKKFAGPRWR